MTPLKKSLLANEAYAKSILPDLTKRISSKIVGLDATLTRSRDIYPRIARGRKGRVIRAFIEGDGELWIELRMYRLDGTGFMDSSRWHNQYWRLRQIEDFENPNEEVGND